MEGGRQCLVTTLHGVSRLDLLGLPRDSDLVLCGNVKITYEVSDSMVLGGAGRDQSQTKSSSRRWDTAL